MPRRLPVRPDLRKLEEEARELLDAIRRGEPEAAGELRAHHPGPVDPGSATLDDARLVLARTYEAPDWPRLVEACALIDAIWRDDVEAIRRLVTANPALLHQEATIRNSNWGPPMTYAANLGRDEIIKALYEMGATDLDRALDRAALQTQIRTARMIHEWLGSPKPPDDALGGPAYTLSIGGTAFLLEIGARVVGADETLLAPVSVVLETDSRKPEAKHGILEMYVEHGVKLPDTPPMALHRGRIDLLEEHLRRDPRLLERTFTHEEIYPPRLGCHDEILATHGTPLAGTTLLHMCVDYDEMEIALWLLAKGMDADARAAVDGDGFGGHTALFSTVVSQPNFWVNHHALPDEAPFTKLLLDRGANVDVRASLRKQLHPGYGPDVMHEYRDVTPLEWGERFHRQIFVSREAMRLIGAAHSASA